MLCGERQLASLASLSFSLSHHHISFFGKQIQNTKKSEIVEDFSKGQIRSSYMAKTYRNLITQLDGTLELLGYFFSDQSEVEK